MHRQAIKELLKDSLRAIRHEAEEVGLDHVMQQRLEEAASSGALAAVYLAIEERVKGLGFSLLSDIAPEDRDFVRGQAAFGVQMWSILLDWASDEDPEWDNFEEGDLNPFEFEGVSEGPTGFDLTDNQE